jgi:hypothetical protein
VHRDRGFHLSLMLTKSLERSSNVLKYRTLLGVTNPTFLDERFNE